MDDKSINLQYDEGGNHMAEMAETTYKSRHDVPFPPFTEFSKFIREMSIVRNDPGFNYEQELPSTSNSTIVKISKTRKQYFLMEKESGYF
jgi:hypothetical protein